MSWKWACFDPYLFLSHVGVVGCFALMQLEILSEILMSGCWKGKALGLGGISVLGEKTVLAKIPVLQSFACLSASVELLVCKAAHE